METFYLIIVVLLFFLAISDLVVGVSNDAVNFLNSAIGAKAATFKVVLAVATLGILVGCTFSSGMMEVARKGIFHPELFHFSEIILIFLAVMITDVILLDAFNTFGMPTSTTVSIVFELLGAAVAMSLIKIYFVDTDNLALGEYINSGKALAIISGILLSVVVAFSAGMIFQFLTRLLFSFEYEKRMKSFGAIWGGLAIAAITYFLLVKGSKGASFMNADLKQQIQQNTWPIIGVSFIIWTVILQVVSMFTRINILKGIVLIGTFSLAMAFAGNDLVNFIGVPLAGYNSFQIWSQSGEAANAFLMDGLAGKVPTPTLLLLIAGVIMAITLWMSKKARSVVQTSLDLGRQHEGSERFASYAVSRSMVRYSGRMANAVNRILPNRMNAFLDRQFDERAFTAKQSHLGSDAPSFDMIRAAVTLVVASILITIGTNLKLPLSTTYVTFMVFMGTSLADGAWGRESAVYRVSGVISVVAGWFFTAFSAFTVAFVIANIFYFGGTPAIIGTLLAAGLVIYRSHRHHGKRLEEQLAFEQSIEKDSLTKDHVVELCAHHMDSVLVKLNSLLEKTLKGLAEENLPALNRAKAESRELLRQAEIIKRRTNQSLDKIIDDEIEIAHLYLLMADYLSEMAQSVGAIVESSRAHVDNNHKPFLPVQIEELQELQTRIKTRFQAVKDIFESSDAAAAASYFEELPASTKFIRSLRKNQIKRIKRQEIGTRNSILYLSHLAEYRNVVLFSDRLVRVFDEFILHD